MHPHCWQTLGFSTTHNATPNPSPNIPRANQSLERLTHESQQAGRAIREAAVRAGRELGKAGRGLGRASATVGRSLRTGAESAHRVGEYTREATTTNGRTCHDLDQRIRNAVEERSRHDRRLGQTYEGYRRALSVIHPEAEQKRKDEDRPDRVAGLIESRIQNRARSHDIGW